jgi:hypothetical protein
MITGSVVPETIVVSDAEFRVAMVAGLARAQKKAGGAKPLAYIMDLSTKMLGRILGGESDTSPKRLWDAHAATGTGLEDIAELYGLRLVPKDAVCDVDNATLVMSGLLNAILTAEHPDSPGGRAITHSELLGMEDLVRQVHAKTGKMLTQIADHRRPRVVGE